MTEAKNAVSVIIPTVGGRAMLLDRTIAMLLDDPATGEVIVMIAASDPETRQVLKRWRGIDFRVREAPSQEPPEAGARPRRDNGARLARFQIVLSLDDDVVPGAGMVTKHLQRHASSGPGLLVLGYMPVVVLDEQAQLSAAARLYSEAYERACAVYSAQPESILLGLWGGNFSLRRSDWLRAVKLPSIEVYHEDREFGLRLRKTGVRALFDPGLRADHHYERSVGDVLAQAERSGRDTHRIREAYPETSGSWDVAVRPLTLRWAASNPLYRASTAVLVSLSGVTNRLRLRRLDFMCVRALASLGFARGYARHQRDRSSLDGRA